MPKGEGIVNSHRSEATSEHGFKFQFEIFFNLCLQLYKLGCDFSVAYEVADIDKLDDTIIDCELNGKKFAFFLQAKHSATKSEVFLKNFFSPTQENCSKKYWKKYNLKQFVGALMSVKIQETLQKYEDHIQRYVIVTNNSVNTENVETVVENCKEFHEIFRKFTDNSAIFVKFGEAFKEKIETIFQAVKDAKLKEELYNLESLEVLEKIVVLSNVPNCEDLEELSGKFVKEIFKDNCSDLLPKLLWQNVHDFIKPVINTTSGPTRKLMKKENFTEIVEILKQEVELRRMTESFIHQEIKFHVKFQSEILKELHSELSGKRVIEYEGNVMLSLLKIYDVLNPSEIKVFLLKLSMLNKPYDKSFNLPQSRIIIHVDCAKNWREILKYENVILIGDKDRFNEVNFEQKMTMKKPLFEEFDENTKVEFFKKIITIQGISVKLAQIQLGLHTIDDQYFQFLNDVAEELTTKDKIYLGEKLPSKEKFYIMRSFFTNSRKLNDKDLLEFLPNAIIDADPGMGKTSTIVNLATIFKKEQPHYWVGMLFLTDFTRMFHEFLQKKEIDFKDILNILTIGQTNPEFCQKLLKIYMSQEENVPIFLFFDGYDEIFPHYSNIVVKLIEKLRERNVKIFITTRSHCLANLELLRNFSLVQMDLFREFQRNIFIRRYLEMKYPEDELEETIGKIKQNILLSGKFDEKFIGTPILLKMIIDIYKRSPELVLNFNKLNIFKIYDEIFEMSFDNYYAKERINPTMNVVTSKRNLEVKKIKEIYSFLAVTTLRMNDVIPQEVVEYDETEVQGRGFVTKSSDGTFHFIHRTFAEYFVGEAIVRQIVRKNYKIMSFIAENIQEQSCKFAHLSLLDKMPKNVLFEVFDGIDEICKIFNQLFFKRGNTNIEHLSIIFEYVSHCISQEQFMNFLTYQFESNEQLTEDHMDVLKKFLDARYERSTTNAFLSKVSSKYFKDKKYFHTNFQNLLIERRILTENESFERIYADLEAQYWKQSKRSVLPSLKLLFKHNTNYSKEIYFAMFENRKETIENDIKLKIEARYEVKNIFETHDLVLMNYLTLFLEDSWNFLEALLAFFHRRDILMRFFTKLSRLHFYADGEIANPFSVQNYSLEDCEVFIKMCIRIFVQNEWEKDTFENKSLLFYCWTSDDTMVMRPFLEHLPPQTVVELTLSPNFNGKSAIEYYTTEEEAKDIPLNYLEYLCKNSQKEHLFKLIVPFDKESTKTHCKNIHLNYNLFCLKENDVIDEELFSKMVGKISEELVKAVKETEANLLYPFACNSDYIALDHSFVEGFFTYLENETDLLNSFGGQRNYLMHCLRKIDENGDNLFHISAKSENRYFMDYLQLKLTTEELTGCLKVTNIRGQNYFHCLVDRYPVWKETYQVLQDDLQEMFLQQDAEGKTPFHCSNVNLFMNFYLLLSDCALTELFSLRDTKENNIFHYLAKDIEEDERPALRIFFTWTMSPVIKKEIKKACLVKNSDGQTPEDLGLRFP